MPTLHRVEMPDPDWLKSYPSQYHLNETAANAYLGMPNFLQGLLNQFGSDQPKDPPAMPTPPTLYVHAADIPKWGSSFTDYQQRVKDLNTSAADLVKGTEAALKLIKDAGVTSTTGQQAVNAIADDLTKQASQPPPQPDMFEDEWAMASVAQAMEDGAQALSNGHNDSSATEKALKDLAAKFADLAGQKATDAQAMQQLQNQIKDLANQNTNGSGAPPLVNPAASPNATPQQDPFGGNQDIFGNGANKFDPPSATDQSGAQPSSPTGQTPSLPSANPTPVTANTPTSSGPDMSGLMNMAALQSMMSGMRGDDNYGNRLDDLDRGRYEREQPPLQPIQNTPALNTPQPPSANPAAPAPAAAPQSAVPANNTPANPAPAHPGARMPDADGAVNYSFPDGVVERVSAVVAQALDAAFADHDKTDAQRAYAKTSAKWSDSKQIGEKVDPGDTEKMMTGNVAVWQNPLRTALIRKTGDGTDAMIDVIIAGQLVSLPELLERGVDVFESGGKVADSAGSLALPPVPDGTGGTPGASGSSAPADDGKVMKHTFDGFRHPPGIEVSSVTAKDSGAVMPVATDSGPAAPLAAAVPAS